MTIATTNAARKLHWNYFLALESDMERVSRYVEFCDANFDVFSIELARLLFAAASEVDVVAKLLCELLDPPAPRGNINEYRMVLTRALPELSSTKVFVPRYGLWFEPWSSWAIGTDNPPWWRSYNQVKHARDAHFHEATLTNALQALGGLMILTFYLYGHSLAVPPAKCLAPKEVTYALQPASSLLRFDGSYYYTNLIVGGRLGNAV